MLANLVLANLVLANLGSRVTGVTGHGGSRGFRGFSDPVTGEPGRAEPGEPGRAAPWTLHINKKSKNPSSILGSSLGKNHKKTEHGRGGPFSDFL